MTRLLRVYSGSDSSPIIDYTDDVNWVEAQLASMAHDGESGVGEIGIYDSDGVIPDSVPPGKFLNSHNVVLVEDGPYRLFRGRIQTRASSRRMRRGRRTKYIKCNLGDYNTDLRGIVVDNWVRPLESNIARVQALAAAYLAGSPRATTNLNATTYVSGSNALTIPAKTYTGMYVGDVLADIAREAGKIFFVTIDGELFYDGSESNAYASSLRISDDPADANATTYAPEWYAGDASTEDGIDTASHIRSYYGTESSVTANTGQQAYNDYWETLWWDPLAEVASNALPRAVARLQEVQDTLTISCKIGPIPWAQLGSIKAGQTIQVKARAAKGGRGPTGTFLGDSFTTLRIAELRWLMPEPMTYFAQLQLSRPPRISPYGSGDQALVTAKTAILGGPTATLSYGSGIPVTAYQMTETNKAPGSWMSAANFVAGSGTDFASLIGSACRVSPPDGLYIGERIYYAAVQTNSALPADAGYIGARLTVTLRSNTHSAGFHGGLNGEEAPVKGPHQVTVVYGSSTPTTAGLQGGGQLGIVDGNATDKVVQLSIPSVQWGSYMTIYFQPMFRMIKDSACESTHSAGGWGDGTSAIGNLTLAATTATGPGWVTGGAIGTRNGVNTAFTLVGGYRAIDEVWRNGVSLPLTSIDTSGGSPNITTVGWAPIATDTFLLHYLI